MLSDVPNIFFYPIETEQQLLACKDEMRTKKDPDPCLCLGFYAKGPVRWDSRWVTENDSDFNPVLWDSEFYRQAKLDPNLKWDGFKLPNLLGKLTEEEAYAVAKHPFIVGHQDYDRGFTFKEKYIPDSINYFSRINTLEQTCRMLHIADEIHAIDSSILNLSDLMETPYCKRFVFHRYARKGLPPTLRKAWEILD